MKASFYEMKAPFSRFPLTPMEPVARESRCEEHENDLSMRSQGFEFEKIKY